MLSERVTYNPPPSFIVSYIGLERNRMNTGGWHGAAQGGTSSKPLFLELFGYCAGFFGVLMRRWRVIVHYGLVSFFVLIHLFFGIPDCRMIDCMVFGGMLLLPCFWTVTKKTSFPSCFMYRKWLPLVLRCVKPFLLRSFTTSRKFQFFILFINLSIRHYRRCAISRRITQGLVMLMRTMEQKG